MAFNNVIRQRDRRLPGRIQHAHLPPAPRRRSRRPTCELTSAFARDSVQNSQVRIQIKNAGGAADPYIADGAGAPAIHRSPSPPTSRQLNPGIVQTVQGRMNQNLARLLVVIQKPRPRKNLDRCHRHRCAKRSGTSARGTTSVGGTPVGLGWQAFLSRFPPTR